MHYAPACSHNTGACGGAHIVSGTLRAEVSLPSDTLEQSFNRVDALCCSECCAQATGNNGQSTSNLDSRSGGGSGSNSVVIMAVLVSVAVALVTLLIASVFCCYR